LKILKGAAARDFGRGQGGEAGTSPLRAVTADPTRATAKRTAARRVLEQKAVWRRCSSVEDPPGIFSFVAPCHTASCSKTAPFIIFKQALTPIDARQSMLVESHGGSWQHGMNRLQSGLKIQPRRQPAKHAPRQPRHEQ